MRGGGVRWSGSEGEKERGLSRRTRSGGGGVGESEWAESVRGRSKGAETEGENVRGPSRRGRSRGGGVGESEGRVGGVDVDWHRKGCCESDTSWHSTGTILYFPYPVNIKYDSISLQVITHC
jgi:hypothetical protein